MLARDMPPAEQAMRGLSSQRPVEVAAAVLSAAALPAAAVYRARAQRSRLIPVCVYAMMNVDCTSLY